MAENLENEDWRKEAPKLSGIPVREIFSVPEGYFEELTNKITSSVYLESLTNESLESGYSLPANYFDDLSGNIQTSAFLDSIKPSSESELYKVSDQYFEKSRLVILSKTIDAGKKPKILRLWQSDLLKYASAACFVIVAGFGVYFNQDNGVKATATASYSDAATEQMLFDIDEDVIIEHIQSTSPQAVSTSNDQAELETYILNNFSSADLTTEY
ncbi:MAG: hypothetical protein V4687_00220 [Bacteroidota bacterium]